MNARKAIVTLSVLLGLSVCGNAFLGGMALSRAPFMEPPRHMMRGDGPEGRPEGGRMRDGLREFGRDLPPEVRQPIMDAFQQDREQRTEYMRQIGEARRASLDALRAEPFDAAKLREALVAQRSAQATIQEHVHELLVGVIEKLTPEQRQQLANSAQRLFK